MSYKNAATAEELEAVIGGDVPVAEAEHAGSADSAAQAAKVGDANVGSSTRPVYLDAGTPKQCGSTLNVGISGKAATAGYAQTAKSDGDGNQISTTYAKQTGSYPTLGAGYLPNIKILRGSSNAGWYKIGSVDINDIGTGNTSLSVILFINSVYPDQTTGSHAGLSGEIEVDFRTLADKSGFDYARISISSGNLREENICVTYSGTVAYLYYNLDAYYESIQVIKNGECSNNSGANAKLPIFNFENTFYGTTAPADAVYAVNRNMAAYDGDGNVISSTYAKTAQVNNVSFVPDTGNAVTISAPTVSGTRVQMDYNGWLCIVGSATGNGYIGLRIVDSSGAEKWGAVNATFNCFPGHPIYFLPVHEGDYVNITWDADVTILKLKLIRTVSL